MSWYNVIACISDYWDVVCHKNTIASKRYKVSKEKAHILKETIKCLGLLFLGDKKNLPQERKIAVCQLASPRTHKQLHGFWGMTGFCHIWIHNFGLLAKPLYNKLQGPKTALSEWNKACDHAYSSYKSLESESLCNEEIWIHRFTQGRVVVVRVKW